jgi:signal transduction histidine kinase
MEEEEILHLRKLLHDTKSNLAVIYGYLQLLQKKAEEDSKEKEWIDRMISESRKLEVGIDEVRRLIKGE